MAVVRRSTKEEILLAAERLMAAHGIDGVSLRQIGAASGNGNNSAVIYHFGTKDQLVSAIFEYRLPRLRARRGFLIEERRPADLRGWLECQIRAVLEQSELEDSHYMSFVASLQMHDGAEGFKHLPAEFHDSAIDFEANLRSHLTDLEEPLLSLRLSQALSFIVHAAAARERMRGRGETLLPFALEVGNLVEALEGFLTAPVSSSTRAALQGVRPAKPLRPLVP
ncbi:MAG: helix-turn-helix domain containing protein [Actinomycetota bacterium]|nr:helix-turn-helix domain containing protein [Actinomycetota bacterium]